MLASQFALRASPDRHYPEAVLTVWIGSNPHEGTATTWGQMGPKIRTVNRLLANSEAIFRELKCQG
jgi:hypothetical protein